VSKQNQQADGDIHEDQLLNFLVNALAGAFGVSLGENADLDPEDIYEVLVGATANGTSISHSATGVRTVPWARISCVTPNQVRP
jgi:hypothetical protein